MLSDKLDLIEKRYIELEKQLSSPDIINDRQAFTKHSKELTELRTIIEKYREYKSTLREIEDTEGMMEEEGMKELAEVELDELKNTKAALIKEMEYHSSFDWLMPVVEKIHAEYYKPKYEEHQVFDLIFTIENLLGSGYNSFAGEKRMLERIPFNIENLFERVCMFLKWYNKNKAK